MPHLRELVQHLNELVGSHPDMTFHFMEVCGTHTTSVSRHGLDSIFPPGLSLVAGPGCPVCVMPTGYIDQALGLACQPEVIVASFGDLMRVPGSNGITLSHPGESRNRVRVVYSPLDAVRIAEENPDRQIVFLSVGFETTAPVTAMALDKAECEGIGNFSILPGNRLIPPALRWLALTGDISLDGFLAPGHVSTVIGMEPYRFLAEDMAIPVVIGGFSPEEILGALLVLVSLTAAGRSKVVNAYPRAVRPGGNRRAMELIARFFTPVLAPWRGIGAIPESGLGLKDRYRHRDASLRFGVPYHAMRDPAGCRCGEVLTGRVTPGQCPLFASACRPEHPVGPCMVSSEGTCAAYFRYGKGGSRVVPDHIVAW